MTDPKDRGYQPTQNAPANPTPPRGRPGTTGSLDVELARVKAERDRLRDENETLRQELNNQCSCLSPGHECHTCCVLRKLSEKGVLNDE